jgi:hypothetical protein
MDHLRKYRKPLAAALGLVAAAVMFVGIAHDQDVKAENASAFSWRMANNLHRPMFGDTIDAVDSPWYKVEGDFKTTASEVRVRWNPAYHDIGPSGGRASDMDYYGTLKEGQKFTDITRVIQAGSYLEDAYDGNGAWQGTEEMSYIGILYEEFVGDLAEDDPLRDWLETCGLKPGDVVFIALGKTNAVIGEQTDGIPYYREASSVRN